MKNTFSFSNVLKLSKKQINALETNYLLIFCNNWLYKCVNDRNYASFIESRLKLQGIKNVLVIDKKYLGG